MKIILSIVLFLNSVGSLLAKDLTVYVWLDERSGALKPAEKAELEVTPSLRLGVGGNFHKEMSRAEANKYVLQLDDAPSSIDIGIDHLGYHSLPVCDLAGNEDQVLHVRLLSKRYDIDASECFGIKAHYEFLFRKTLQMGKGTAPRDELIKRARKKYADGLLSLPNPNRPRRSFSEKTRIMLDRMQEEEDQDYRDLNGMLDGLYDTFEMDGFQSLTPSTWDTTYWANEREIKAKVELKGTHGTYQVGNKIHLLENIDIQEDDNGGYLITGNFRFNPGQQGQKIGKISWRVSDEQTFQETKSPRPNGEPSWVGTMVRAPYDDDE